MTPLRSLGSVVVLVVLGGCAQIDVGLDVERLRGAQATGDAFTAKLTEEYRQITLVQADEMNDWADAGHFARKGLRAAEGEVVQPEPIDAWDLPADKVGALTLARRKMVGLLDANARERFPDLAGHAQGRFDCWIERQEENVRPGHVAICRDAFYVTLAKLETAMAPKLEAKAEPTPPPLPPPPPPAKEPKPILLFFAFDSAILTAASRTSVEGAVELAKKVGAKDFAVTGYADRAGPAPYNLELSLRRAHAARDALVARGASAGSVSVAGRGEDHPFVTTPDDVAEAANRRVEIIVLR